MTRKDKKFWRSSLIFCGVALFATLFFTYFYDVVLYYRYYCGLGVIATLLAFELFRFVKGRKLFYETDSYKALYKEVNPEDVNFAGLLLPYRMSMIWGHLNKIVAVLGVFGSIFYTGFLSVYLIMLSLVLNGYFLYYLVTTKKV